LSREAAVRRPSAADYDGLKKKVGVKRTQITQPAFAEYVYDLNKDAD